MCCFIKEPMHCFLRIGLHINALVASAAVSYIPTIAEGVVRAVREHSCSRPYCSNYDEPHLAMLAMVL